ncbi:MAG: hypothetical protein WBX05_16020, partial [Pseudolabrys sp.]
VQKWKADTEGAVQSANIESIVGQMIHKRSVIKLLLLLLVLLAPEAARCGIPTTESLAKETLPGVMITEGKTPRGFPYLSGGVSSNEREVIEELGKAYNVKLSFAEKRGSYLADVRVVIAEAKGAEIIAITTNGPLFYIQVPPGNYSVKATFNGVSKGISRLELPKGKTVRQTLTWDLGEQSEDVY